MKTLFILTFFFTISFYCKSQEMVSLPHGGIIFDSCFADTVDWSCSEGGFTIYFCSSCDSSEIVIFMGGSYSTKTIKVPFSQNISYKVSSYKPRKYGVNFYFYDKGGVRFLDIEVEKKYWKQLDQFLREIQVPKFGIE